MYKAWIMLGLTLWFTTSMSFGYFAFAPLGHDLIAEFHLSKGQFGLINFAAGLGIVTFSIVLGNLVDRFGPRFMMIAGPAVMALGCVGISFSMSLLQILAFSVLVGIGYSCMTPLTNRVIYDWFTYRMQAMAIGLKQAGMPFGVALGALVLSAVSNQHSWRISYLAVAFIITAAGLISFFSYSDPPSNKFKRSKADPEKALEKEKQGYKSLLTSPGVIKNGLLGLGFAIWQVSLITFFVIFLRESVGMPELTGNRYLFIVQFSGALARPAVGALSDLIWHGDYRLVLTVMGLGNVVVILLMALAPAVLFSVPIITFFAVILGVAGMGWFGPFCASMIKSIGTEKAGFASGVITVINLTGMSLWAPIFGYITDFTGSFALPLLVVASFLMTATLIFALVGERPKGTDTGASI